MRNLINFLLKYNHWFLFVLLEIISLTLLFRFNNYQGSAFFTSANYVAGLVYEASNQVTRYFGLTEVNKDLTARNVELEIEVERLSQALEQYTQDTTGIANLRKEALKDYVLYDAKVINNSVTHPDNFITIDKGEVDGIRNGSGLRKRRSRHCVPHRTTSCHRPAGIELQKQHQLQNQKNIVFRFSEMGRRILAIRLCKRLTPTFGIFIG